MKKVLQVKSKITGNWEYVFCRNPLESHPVTTKYRTKALPAIDIEYFQAKFGNHEFRVI